MAQHFYLGLKCHFPALMSRNSAIPVQCYHTCNVNITINCHGGKREKKYKNRGQIKLAKMKSNMDERKRSDGFKRKA